VAGDPRSGSTNCGRNARKNRETFGLSKLTAGPCRNAGRKRLGGVAGVLVALWRFSWEPHAEGVGSRPAVGPRTAAAGAPAPWQDRAPAATGPRPSTATLLLGQVRYANRELARDPASVFFTVVLPVLLVALFPTIFGQDETLPGRGMTLPQFLAPVLAVYGIAVAAYVNLPEGIARARDRGILKRLVARPCRPGPTWRDGSARRCGSACWPRC
jgi:hypothetical protein